MPPRKNPLPGSGDSSGDLPPDSVEAGVGQPKKGTKADLAVQIAELQKNAESGLQVAEVITSALYNDRNRELLAQHASEHLAEFDRLKEEREIALQELRTTHESLVAELKKPTIIKTNLEQLLGQWSELVERITQPLSDEQAGESLRRVIQDLREGEREAELVAEIGRLNREMGGRWRRVNGQRKEFIETPVDFQQRTFSTTAGGITGSEIVDRATTALASAESYYETRGDGRALDARVEAARAVSTELDTTADIMQQILDTLPAEYPHCEEARAMESHLLDCRAIIGSYDEALIDLSANSQYDESLPTLAREVEAHTAIGEARAQWQSVSELTKQYKYYSGDSAAQLKEDIDNGLASLNENIETARTAYIDSTRADKSDHPLSLPERKLSEGDVGYTLDAARNAFLCAVNKFENIRNDLDPVMLPMIRVFDQAVRDVDTDLRSADSVMTMALNMDVADQQAAAHAYRLSVLTLNAMVNDVFPRIEQLATEAQKDGLISPEQYAQYDLEDFNRLRVYASNFGTTINVPAVDTALAATPPPPDAPPASTVETAQQMHDRLRGKVDELHDRSRGHENLTVELIGNFDTRTFQEIGPALAQIETLFAYFQTQTDETLRGETLASIEKISSAIERSLDILRDTGVAPVTPTPAPASSITNPPRVDRAAVQSPATVDIAPPPPPPVPPIGGRHGGHPGGPVPPAGPPPALRGPDIPPPPPPGPPRPPAGLPPQGPQGPDAQQPQPARPIVARTGPLRDAPASFRHHERQPYGRFSDQVRRWFGGIREGLRNVLDWVGAGFNTQLVNWHERNVEAYGGAAEDFREQVEDHRERITGIDERLREQDVPGGERADLLRERNDEVRGMNRSQRELDRALARLENCRARLTPYFEQRRQICADAKLRMEQFTGEREARYNAAVARAKHVDDELSQWTGDRNVWQAKILELRTEAAGARGRRRAELNRQIRQAEREVRVATREMAPRRRELARLQGGISSLAPHITYWTRVKDEFTRVTREVPIDQGQFGGREAAALQTARHPFGRTPTTTDTFPPAPGVPPGGVPAAGGGGGGQAGPDGAPGAGPDQGPQQPEAVDAHIFVTPRAIAAEVFRLYGRGRIGVATPEGMESLVEEFVVATPRFAQGPDAGMQLSRLPEFFGEFNAFLRGRDFRTIGGAQMRTLRQHLREMGGIGGGGGGAVADQQPVAGAPAAGAAAEAVGPLPEAAALSEQEQIWLNEQIRRVAGVRTDDQCAAIRRAMADLSYHANPVGDYRNRYQSGRETAQRRALGTLETQIKRADFFVQRPENERVELLNTAHALSRELMQWTLDNHLNAWGGNERRYFVSMFWDLMKYHAHVSGGVQIENPQPGKQIVSNIAELRATEVGRVLGNAFDNILGMSEGQLLRILETCYFDASPVGNSSEAQLRQRLTVQRMKRYFVEQNTPLPDHEGQPAPDFSQHLQSFMAEYGMHGGRAFRRNNEYTLRVKRVSYALDAIDVAHATEEQNARSARAYTLLKAWVFANGGQEGFEGVRVYASVEERLGRTPETPPLPPGTPPTPGTPPPPPAGGSPDAPPAGGPPGPAGTTPDQGAPQPDAGAAHLIERGDDVMPHRRVIGTLFRMMRDEAATLENKFQGNGEYAQLRDAIINKPIFLNSSDEEFLEYRRMYRAWRDWIVAHDGQAELDAMPSYLNVELLIEGRTNRQVIEVYDAHHSGGESIADDDHPTQNEDAFLVDETTQTFAVFDGIGSRVGSERASSRATELLQEKIKVILDSAPIGEVSQQLLAVAQEISGEVSQIDPSKSDEDNEQAVGVFAKIIHDTSDNNALKAVVINAGDCRVYRVRGDQIDLVTIDDADFFRERGLSDQERQDLLREYDNLDRKPEPSDGLLYEYHGKRHVINEAYGNRRGINLRASHVGLEPGDLLILSSDGVHDNLTRDEIMRAVQAPGTSQERASALARAAHHRGSQRPRHWRSKGDDITAVVIEIPVV